MNNLMGEDGVSEHFAFARLVDSLPISQYDVTKQILGTNQPSNQVSPPLAAHGSSLSVRSGTRRKEKGKREEQAYVAGAGNNGGRGSRARGRGDGGQQEAGTSNRVDHRRCFLCHHLGDM